ncbi:MAG: cephalosporin hydroxylase [Candidatus Aenigmatarchaeota archaeon]|nr:MAG: cephalosporin hydroxylase [Candidatus Aenigmarchaeota archaeon]
MSSSSIMSRSRRILKEKGIRGLLVKMWLRADRARLKLLERYYTAQFHKIYYNKPDTVQGVHWFGTKVQKLPSDLWMYQEIIHETNPDVIVETGTADGGSAMFFASLFDLRKRGEIVTIDILPCKASHPRVTKLIGSSTDPSIVEKVKKMADGKKALVILDSDHGMAHVLKEMESYAALVPIGGYMVVEDTNINGHPVDPLFGPGPMEAVREFLKGRNDFVADLRRERLLLTMHPGGWLKRVR